ncbi:FAD-binding domain-containing protein [Aspergillus heteromorphus CBS 117.55]|uniref:FAD-binding domain-containing protein n=1 Tax=Aspergillus heteromorphus CBS 117.55 TaxID=1448321 RepID=A0A317VDM9_9EURO|nr:FAD-binding domain-containing protein [Aspergillus heteromorphus CBS 117.55]PWY71002.1 FAD-binding domain-containing protein [Aspergillus heteromorphus CBS 117.55]
MKASTVAASVAALATRALASSSSSSCHCMPGDSCWPSTSSWDSLNTTVGGRLVATVPIGTPCHDPNYNGDECTTLQDNWYYPQTHFVSSSSVMQSYFANQSCDPFTAESRACELGNYVSYAVNVSSAADVAATVKFAKSNNLRLVIRNTGHDYLGRSTGAGALSVWTHSLNSVAYEDYSDSTYSGPAYKLGSGVMGYQVLDALEGSGHVLVGGECPTVGLAGGYTQGGGHSALSTMFGLGADQTLSFEVVTAAGDIITASRTNNTDLYWALSGGGAGNYAVVTSLTAKAHADAIVSGAGLEITTANITTDLFFEAVERFHTYLPAMIDAGTTVIYEMTDYAFLINPLTAYNQTSAQVEAVLAPFLSALTELEVPYTVAYTQFDSYYDFYENYMGPLPYGNLDVGTYNYGGRLLPRSTIEANTTNLVAALRNITEQGVIAVGVGLNVTSANDTDNAVFAPWRSAAVTMQIGSPWNETAPWADMVAAQLKITHELVPQLEAVTPGGGAYENEANFRQLNWQEAFFGENYDKLCQIKEKWDPDHVFYVTKGVGSEYWDVADNGRMCQSGSSCSA